MIRRLLVANRGEIAVRIIRTCRDLGVETVQVYSKADRDGLAVRLAHRAVGIGEAPAAKSYLNAQALVAAALFTDCDAVHPGYGFLSENAEFAQLCQRKRLIFVGPLPDHIRLMGDKAAARRAAQEAGVPVIPGSDGTVASLAEAQRVASDIGYPILIKASAGGGGKGMRVVASPRDLEPSLQAAQSEALAAVGDARVYLERYLADVRHVEVQVLGDGSQFVQLGERDCTIQRRHQKLVEESPSPALDALQRERLAQAALRLVRHVRYVNAGTVEFVLDNRTSEFFFIEMNTRLQVEHPVTEMTTGLDLVAHQLQLASGEPLAIDQGAVVSRGHAIECRINAEDPARGFMPQPGTITRWSAPSGPDVRIDTHVRAGTSVSPYYDSLIAKVIVHAPSRTEAIARMHRALGELDVQGIATNVALHRTIMSDPRFVQARFNTRFLNEASDLTSETGDAKRARAPVAANQRSHESH
jgi:acetyl-CoA carboxylase biotin carboxylase subunit